MKKPLTPKILSDPNHEFVKTLVYIYSMESFVFKEMNKASRSKDPLMIKMYGPFASALGFIIHCGNFKKEKGQDIIVYRGLKITRENLSKEYIVGNKINLQGFTSTTREMDRALNFAIDSS